MMYPTGSQYRIEYEDYAATICEVGACLREFVLAQTPILAGFDATAQPPAAHGQHLLPWPNRLRDGHYVIGEEEFQAPINEIARNTALHGLCAWQVWDLVEHSAAKVTQRLVLNPSPAWPTWLDMEISHELTKDGLVVTVSARNTGDKLCFFGYGAHPYLATGGQSLDCCELTLPFQTELKVDAIRLLPEALVEWDHPFARGAQINNVNFDTAFTSPTASPWQIELTTGFGRTQVWADESLQWVQLYTPPERDCIAIEPMSVGPDAFNVGPTHDDVTQLAPGDSWRGQWGINALVE